MDHEDKFWEEQEKEILEAIRKGLSKQRPFIDNSGMTVLNYSPDQAQNDIKALMGDYKVYMSKGKESW